MSNWWFVIGDSDLEIALVNLHRGHITGMIRSSLMFDDIDICVAVIEFTEEWEEEDLKMHLPGSRYVEISCRCKAEAALTVVTAFEDVKEEGDVLKIREPWFFGGYCRDGEIMQHNFEL